jgi:hypothetical protein
MSKPRILIADIETLPLEVWTWGLFDQNIGLNQIQSDWTVLSWSAKWLGEKKVMYDDVRSDKPRSDKRVLLGIWRLLDEADIVIWHYGSAFDHKKLNARFILNGFQPPSPYQQIDTKKLASKTFGFTSNKLEYLTDKLNTKYKKSGHRKYPGFDMWKACIKGDVKAFNEMREYNKMDVLSLEEMYLKIIPWHNPLDFRVFKNTTRPECKTCGSNKLQSRGVEHTKSGRFKRYQCTDCGTWMSERGSKNNLLSVEKRAALKGSGK